MMFDIAASVSKIALATPPNRKFALYPPKIGAPDELSGSRLILASPEKAK